MNLTRSEIFFNLAAIVSLITSIVSWCLGYHLSAIFIGIWVPSIIGWMNFFSGKDTGHHRGGQPNA
ncbi:MAG: hypothetical protein KJO98_07870, partial [Rhodothermia bacterium]|nr:hypothetical protein [Rhodothermia bacterium]